MEDIKYTFEFTHDELVCILAGLNSFVKHLSFNGQINEFNVKAYNNAFNVSSSLYIKLSSSVELVANDKNK